MRVGETEVALNFVDFAATKHERRIPPNLCDCQVCHMLVPAYTYEAEVQTWGSNKSTEKGSFEVFTPILKVCART